MQETTSKSDGTKKLRAVFSFGAYASTFTTRTNILPWQRVLIKCQTYREDNKNPPGSSKTVEPKQNRWRKNGRKMILLISRERSVWRRRDDIYKSIKLFLKTRDVWKTSVVRFQENRFDFKDVLNFERFFRSLSWIVFFWISNRKIVNYFMSHSSKNCILPRSQVTVFVRFEPIDDNYSV